MPRERRPPEVQKMFNHINRANRLAVSAIDRAIEVNSTHGLLPGHWAEFRRRLEALRDEADRLIEVLESK